MDKVTLKPCPSDLVEVVARAIYAQRPFVMASTETLNGVQLGKAFDWDGAPAYYQSEITDLAEAAVAALSTRHADDFLAGVKAMQEVAAKMVMERSEQLQARAVDAVLTAQAIRSIDPSSIGEGE